MDSPGLERIWTNVHDSAKRREYYYTDTKLTHPHCTRGGTTIGFYINGTHDLSWVLTADENRAAVRRLDESAQAPRVKIHLDSKAMPRLIQSKLGFHEAMLRGQIRIEGRVMDTLRVGNVLSEFMRKHPFKV